MIKPWIDAHESDRRENLSSDDSSARPGWKVLVVEDEKRMADLLKTGLEEYGYAVTVAYDGAMGSRLAKNTPFNAVICDVVLRKKRFLAVPGNQGVRFTHSHPDADGAGND